MEFDLDYARRVIEAEADAVGAVGHIVDESFAEAVEMIPPNPFSVLKAIMNKLNIAPPNNTMTCRTSDHITASIPPRTV